MAATSESYAALTDAMSRAGVIGDSAEVHGGLCATLCVDGIGGVRAWSDAWLADSSSETRDAEVLRRHLLELGRGSWHALTGAELEFQLVLPEDDAPLSLRVDALASWCHGFVEGIGLSAIDTDALGEAGCGELDEIVGDFIEISRAALEGPASAENEFQLAELIEFVRVGAQTVFELLADRRAHGLRHHLH